MSRLSEFGELLSFLKTRKKLWMFPLFAVLLLLSAFFLIAQSSAAAPFIYALF